MSETWGVPASWLSPGSNFSPRCYIQDKRRRHGEGSSPWAVLVPVSPGEANFWMGGVFCNTDVVTGGCISEHLPLRGGWGIRPQNLRRQVHARRFQDEENTRKVVSRAECGSAALTRNLGGCCAAR